MTHEVNMVALQDPSLLQTRAFLAGAWADADDGRTFQVLNPATTECLARVPLMGCEETLRAIDAAQAAWGAWRQLLAKERAERLRRWFDLMRENAEDLAILMTSEQGKPLSEARGEVAYAASFIEWYSEEAKRCHGELIPAPAVGRRLIVQRESVGVCAAITPWNFPLAMITRKAAPALAAGNPMIVKPAEATPLSALALAVLAERAGIPAGVFQVITGDPVSIGETLTGSPVVRKLSFTGSTQVGRLLYAQCAPTIKKLSLELGGNAPFIVFADADVDAAVQGALASKYRNAGQTCVCANRLYVHDRIHDEFVEKFVSAVRSLKLGNGLEGDVTQGPLIDQKAVRKVESHIEDAVHRGAVIKLGGVRSSLGGNFFEPTVLVDVPWDARVAREETFGPLAPIFRFDSDEQVIALANHTEYGLASYFYSRDVGRIFRVAEALEYGMVGVNTGLISTEVAPFGGVKQSGLGREGAHQGLDEYLETKYIALAGL